MCNFITIKLKEKNNMFYNIINKVFVIIAVFLILLALLVKNKKFKFLNNLYDRLRNIANKYYKYIILLLFLLTVFTSAFKIGEVPYGLHVDEAGMAYDAISLEKYGVDRYLNKFPLYLINYGGGQSAMYAYLVVLLIKLFGYSVKTIRLPALILRIFIFICSFLIIEKENDKLKSSIFMFLLTIVPYFIMQSRWGLDCNLLVGFLTIAICLLILSIMKNTNKILLFFSGVFFGLSLYTYVLSYIIVPILLLFICIYLIYVKKMNFLELIILGIPIFLLAIPLLLMILINNGYINEIKRFYYYSIIKRV